MAAVVPTVLALLLMAATASAAPHSGMEWPTFGQNNQRTSFNANSGLRGAPRTLPPKSGSVETKAKWVVDTKKAVYAPVAVADGVAYVGSDIQAMFAIEVASGKVLWTFPVGGVVHASAAITTDGHVVFPSYDGFLYKLTTAGKLVWKTAIKAGFSSPAIDETLGRIFIGTNDNSTVAVTLSDGKIAWSTTLPNVVTSSPTVYNGVWVFVGGNSGNFFKLDALTGKIIWQYLSGRTVEAAATVGSIHGTDYLLFPSWDGYLYAFDPALVGKDSYLWRFQTQKPIEGHAAVYNNEIFFNSEDNHTYALTFGAEMGSKPTQKWTFAMGSESDSSPAVSNDGSLLFFGDADTNFYGVSTAAGELRCFIKTGGDVFSSPAVTSTLAIVGSADGKVYAMDISDC